MPSPLYDTLLADIKTAMKNRDSNTLTPLRTLNAMIKDATINAGHEPTDADVATIVAKAIKQRTDAAEQFRVGGREDLATQELQEVACFRKYQPEMLDAATVEDIVRKAIAETAAAGKKDMGKVMQAVMPHVKGRADGKLVNQLVQKLLGA